MTTDHLPPTRAAETTAAAEELTSADSVGDDVPRTSLRTAATPDDQRSSKILVGAFIALIAVFVAYFAFGMPGMDHGGGDGSSMAGMDMGGASSRHRVMQPDAFEALINDDAILVNVHDRDEGEIAGTDLTMPYNALDIAKLPSDKSAKLLVYCMTGDMSSTAATELVEMGYTNVVELAGGMAAWKGSGRSLVNEN